MPVFCGKLTETNDHVIWTVTGFFWNMFISPDKEYSTSFENRIWFLTWIPCLVFHSIHSKVYFGSTAPWLRQSKLGSCGSALKERGGPALWEEWRRNTALGASGLGCFHSFTDPRIQNRRSFTKHGTLTGKKFKYRKEWIRKRIFLRAFLLLFFQIFRSGKM